MLRRLTPFTVLPLVLAACSAGVSMAPIEVSQTPEATESPPPSPPPSPSPTPTPEPTPSPVSREATGIAFLAILDEGNRVLCEANRLYDSNDLDMWKLAASTTADGARAQTDAVRELEFPPELETMKQDYIAAEAAFEHSLRVQAAAATLDEWYAADATTYDANTRVAAASNLIRGELGLPSTPGSCAELGY